MSKDFRAYLHDLLSDLTLTATDLKILRNLDLQSCEVWLLRFKISTEIIQIKWYFILKLQLYQCRYVVSDPKYEEFSERIVTDLLQTYVSEINDYWQCNVDQLLKNYAEWCCNVKEIIVNNTVDRQILVSCWRSTNENLTNRKKMFSKSIDIDDYTLL